MKKIKQNFAKKKIDKNTIYAYILLVFFIFWTVGSIFGFIAFGRKDKQSNVVNASANVVDDFYNAPSINLITAQLMSPMVPYPNAKMECVTTLDNKYQLQLTTDSNSRLYYYDRSLDVSNPPGGLLFPLSWFAQDLEWDKDYRISFEVSADGAVSFSDFPELYLVKSVNGVVQEYDSFSMTTGEDSFSYQYFNFFPHVDSSEEFFVYMYLDNADFPFGDVLVFSNPAIYPWFNEIDGYVYTYEQLLAIYNKEIQDSYYNGITTQNAYQEGYDIGKREAYDTINESLINLFSFSTLNFEIGDYELPNAQIEGSGSNLYLTQTYNTAMADLGLNTVDYLNATAYLNFTDFREDFAPFDEYSFKIVCDTDLNIDYNPITIEIWTNVTVYEAISSQVSPQEWNVYIDLSTMRAGEKVEDVIITFKGGMIINGDFVLKTSDVKYNLGFDYGYQIAYNNFIRNYDEYLNEYYNKGVRYGKAIGYGEGYNEGAEAGQEFTFTKLLTAVVDVPINAFKSLFNFEILGVNLTSFFFSMFTIALVLAIIKLII